MQVLSFRHTKQTSKNVPDTTFKVRDHCHITENIYTLHIGIVMSMLNSKIPVRFRNLKNYDSHLIMQELGKFNLKINIIPNGIEKYQYINTINNKLIFIDSLRFLNSSLHSLVKNLGKDDFKYLSQEYDVLDRIRYS